MRASPASVSVNAAGSWAHRRRAMGKVESLGIKRLESVHYYVHDLERSRRFYTEKMDFAEIGGSGEELTKAGRQKSLGFMADDCVVVCIEPRGNESRAARWLRKHPDGVGTLNFEVEDVGEDFRSAREAGRHPHPRRQASERRGRHVRLLLDHHALRGHHLPLHPAGRVPAAVPGLRGARPTAGREEPDRLRGLRPHDLELPHSGPGHPVDGARHGLRALLGDRVPHHGHDRPTAATARASDPS